MLVNRLTPMLLALPVSLAGGPGPARADSALQSLAGIRSAAESSVRRVLDATANPVELRVNSLDERLRLPACGGKLDTFVTPPRAGQSRVIARVGCASPAWTLNVPVDLRSTHPVLVLKRAVGRGEMLQAADVSTQSRVLPGIASPYVARVQDLEGRLTRRPLPAGTALAAESLGAALLIKKGQQVTLIARTSGFEVRAPGRALADAAASQRVRVQNLNSLKIVEGLADTEGVVKVTP